jgi:hypothetical protein
VFMSNEQSANEVLIIRGIIDSAGRFTPRRCSSTYFVRTWPDTSGSDYVVELLDRSNQLLHRTYANVVKDQNCDLLESARFRLHAYIGLRDDAATVQLRKGELVLWRREIPAPPSLKLAISRGSISREQPITLQLKVSPPGDGAFVQIIYQWGGRSFHVVNTVAPRSAVTIDLHGRPGGSACRFVVIYSNGMRSAVAVTREFALKPLGPTLTIRQPNARAVLTAGQHLVLQGSVVDSERPGGAKQEDVTWWIDGNIVGRGLIGGVDRLMPGRHRVELRYQERDDLSAEVTVTVKRSKVKTADEWETFDHWEAIL